MTQLKYIIKGSYCASLILKGNFHTNDHDHFFRSIWIQLVFVLDWTELNWTVNHIMIQLGFSHQFSVAKYIVRILFCFVFLFWLCFLISFPNLYSWGFKFSLPQRLHCRDFEGIWIWIYDDSKIVHCNFKLSFYVWFMVSIFPYRCLWVLV